ncbi:toxin glutamine deamidase domain-containing protein [Streptomyces sp. NPDC094149]|uniref:toxin glutamine deamidase domain-containing protein n=1 Tax=Streptomyces sp. NPDC094149 TaxID=3155079 RepID=UPI003329924A
MHTPIRTPGTSAAQNHAAGPAAPQAPGSPQATPGDTTSPNHPNQDSLQDIRSDLDHYPGGLTDPDPADQQALSDAVPRNEDGTPQRYPDPFDGNWSQLQNDGGVNVPGRSNNCADCSRSFLETWYGNPQVSAPRTLDTDANGKPDLWSPEDNANDNQIRWTGAAHTYAGPGGDPNTANNIANTLQQAGPGSAAIVQVDWPGGGGHAFNVVNHNGKIVWIDTQSGQVSTQPLHIDQATHVWHIPLDANRNPIDTSQPPTNASQGQTNSQNQSSSQNPNGETSQPENSGDDGQSENNQTPQDGASGDAQKAGDTADSGGDHHEPKASVASDRSDGEASAQSSPTDARTSPTSSDRTASPEHTGGDRTHDEPDHDNAPSQSDNNGPSVPDHTPDGRERPSEGSSQGPHSPLDTGSSDQRRPHEALSEDGRPSPAESSSTADHRSGSDGSTHSAEESRRPASTTESQTRSDSSEGPERLTHTTPDVADNSAPARGTPPAETVTNGPGNPDAPTQASVPRQQAPHDPPASTARTSAPRATDQHRGVAASTEPTAGHRTDRQATPLTDSARPTPADPAGVSPSRFDPEEVRGSAPFDQVQQADHTHVEMPLENSQRVLRQTHEVSQIDLGPVLDNAHRWASDGSLARAVEEARNGNITQSRLNEILGKGFEELSSEQKMAVVAGIARISNTFHEAHAAGNSPVQGDPGRRRPKGVTNDINPLPGVSMHENHEVRRMKEDDDKSPPDALARDYAVTHEAESSDPADKAKKDNEFEALWKQRKDGDMRPDMSGKNYAVLEVHENVDGKVVVRYVIDSSIPGSDRYHHDHSEPHLGEWMRNVEAQAPGRFKAVALFTEFEPCGDRTGTGGANCSDYLSHDMERDPDAPRARTKTARENRPEEVQKNPPKSDLRISYGIGYRKGAMGYQAAAEAGEYASATERREAIKEGRALDNAERERVKAITDEQMVKYRGEWLRVWMNTVAPTAAGG